MEAPLGLLLLLLLLRATAAARHAWAAVLTLIQRSDAAA